MTTKKQTAKIERDSRLAAGGVAAAAVVSIVASLTSLPSAGAADFQNNNYQFFSSVEATMQGPLGLESLEIKASWSDDDVREDQRPDKIEAFQSEEVWMEWIDPSGVPAVAGEPARSELIEFGSAWNVEGNFLEITELKMVDRNGDGGEKVVSYLNGLLEFDWKESESRYYLRKMTDDADQKGNIPIKDVAEPSLTLGFITLASLMLGSRKKKEAKKT